jgi:hypothetical protein
MDDEHEKSRMKELANDLASLISSLNLKVKICLSKYSKGELVDLTWGREIHLSLDLKEEPMKVNDVHNSQHQWSTFLKPVRMPNHYKIL